MNNKQKLVYLSLIALTIIGILSGASYAYFSIENKIGNETVIESGTMALTFTDGSTITADKLIPGEYIEKTFSVRNTGTVRTNYDIYLSEVVNTFVNQSDLVYEIISSNGYNTSNQIQVPNTETKIINNYPIDPLQEHTYTLRITYKLTNEVQNDNMGRGFTAKININEYTTNTTEKLLKLLDTSGNLVDKQMISASTTDYYYNLANTSLTGTTNIYCNNGGIPRIENNQLIVSGLTVDTECKMSTDIVDTMTNRLNTSKTGVVMTNNQENVPRMIVNTSNEVVLDLNGKEIKSIGINDDSKGTYNENYEVFRILNATFTVNDSVGTGGAYTGTTSRVIYAQNNSNVTINNGNFNGRQSLVTYGSNINITINGGHLYSNDYAAIGANECVSNCNVTINDGVFTGTVNAVVNNISTVNIIGGYFYSDGGYTISNPNANGTYNIYGGIFESINDYTLYNKGTITISGNQATFDNNGNYLSGTYMHNENKNIIYNDGGTITINNGTFEANKTITQISNNNNPLWNYNGTITINDGLFDGGHGIRNQFGTVTINDATVKTYGTHNFYYTPVCQEDFNGTINVNGGYFESLYGFGIRNQGKGTINIKNANINAHNEIAIVNVNYNNHAGIINVCRANLINNKIVYNSLKDTTGYIYYHTNAFGSVTPTFDGATANIQIKDEVCD